VFGQHSKPWYFVLVAVALASASYYLVEQPMLRVRERDRKMENVLAAAA
jgi:peptidoglycan/LPS O-acetylase OafA/YrhL